MRLNMRWALPLILLAGCSSAPPEQVGIRFLEAMQSGDRATMDELMCQKGAVEWAAEITGVKTFEVTNITETSEDEIGLTWVDFSYTLTGIDESDGLTGRIELTKKPLKLIESSQAAAAQLGLTPEAIGPEDLNKKRPCVMFVREFPY